MCETDGVTNEHKNIGHTNKALYSNIHFGVSHHLELK